MFSYKLVPALLLTAVLGFANTATLNITGVVASTGSAGFYTATLNDVTNVTQYVLCDDYDHRAATGDAVYDYSTLSSDINFGSGTISGVEFAGVTNAVFKYEEAAEILYKMYSLTYQNKATADANITSVTNYQNALWSLFSSNKTDTGNLLSGIASIVTAQANDATSFLRTTILPSVKVYTPDGSATTNLSLKSTYSQEFLQYVPTPEPASFALMGGGLLLCGLALKRYRRR